MTLEEYKKRVKESLIKNNNCTEAIAEELMQEHEDDFQRYLEEAWSPEAMSLAMVMNLI